MRRALVSVTDLRTSSHWFPSMFRYGSVGLLALCFDFGTYAGLLALHFVPVVAGAAAGLVAAVVHFLLSKFFSFRNNQSRMRRQAATYAALGLMWWVVTLGMIQVGTAVLHLNPLIAKLIAVAINFPLGFIGHRFLTFGNALDGVFAALGRPQPAGTERRASL